MALRDDPGNVRAKALKVRIDAQRGLMSNAQAEVVLRGLISEQPGDPYLEVATVALLLREGDRQEGVSQLKVIADTYKGDPYVNQVLAGVLGCDRATWDEAWTHYKIALQSGPLATPTYQSAAYYLAKHKEPSLVSLTLQGTTSWSRAAIRTRLRVSTACIKF